MLQLYSTLAREKVPLSTKTGKPVTIYTCGLTVYSQPHIGNWVSYVYWDVLVRLLSQQGIPVKRVQNITDVGHLVSDDDDGEDKMQKGAKKEGITAWDVAEKYSKIAEHEAYDLLRLKRPDAMPRATDYIDEQIAFVQELENKGYTYVIDGDGLYFDTARLSDYGKLARLDIDGLEAGKRVQNRQKRNKTDFAVWKFSPKGAKRDMEWDSPWGKGFPGWHLECSVMARELLGDQIDIHTGGVDHIAVHHTNEIAQTEAITNKPFAHIWLHNNHLKVDGQRMAKSIGNIITLQDIIDRGYSVDAFKLLVLSSHYRSEGNFTWEIMAAAGARLRDLQHMADLQHQARDVDPWLHAAEWTDQLLSAMSDDLNTPQALTILSEIAQRCSDHPLAPTDTIQLRQLLKFIDSVFGLTLSQRPSVSPSEQKMLDERDSARERKDYAAADELRHRLLEAGIMVRDTAHGQIWAKE